MFFSLAILAALTVLFQQYVTSRVVFGTDFYTFWVGGRAVFLEGKSPYTSEVTRLSQLGIYGRPANPDQDELRFAYVPYSLIPLLPAIRMPLAWARAYWLAFSFLVLFGSLIWVSSQKKIPFWLLVLVPFGFPIVRGFIMGQFAPIVVFLLIAVLAMMTGGEERSWHVQFAIGALLAWLTIKPQLTWFFLLFIFADAARSRKWAVLWGLLAGLGLLFLLSWSWVPGWPNQWLDQVDSYSRYVPFEPLAHSYARFVLGETLASFGGTIIIIIAALLQIAVIRLWWRARVTGALVLGCGALLTVLIHPHIMSSELAVLYLPIFAWMWTPETPRSSRYLVILAALLVPWALFFVTFNGGERHLATILTTLPYLGWLAWLLNVEVVRVTRNGWSWTRIG